MSHFYPQTGDEQADAEHAHHRIAHLEGITEEADLGRAAGGEAYTLSALPKAGKKLKGAGGKPERLATTDAKKLAEYDAVDSLTKVMPWYVHPTWPYPPLPGTAHTSIQPPHIAA